MLKGNVGQGYGHWPISSRQELFHKVPVVHGRPVGGTGIQFSTGKCISIPRDSILFMVTVIPPALSALALLPCIKAFDADTDPGRIDMAKQANDARDIFSNRPDKAIHGAAVKYARCRRDLQ